MLLISATIAAKATKAKGFVGFIPLGNGYWDQVYVPYECPYSGYGCKYTDYVEHRQYQVYEQDGNNYYPIQP